MEEKKYQLDNKFPQTSAWAYAIGGAGSQASFYIVSNYLMLFYTDVVTLSAAAISLIMLIARIWDAVNDPMMGAIVDRTNTKYGRFRPWIMIGPPFLAVFNVLTFTAWPLEGAAKAIVCAICYIGAGMAYTVVSVAVNGLVNRLTNNPKHKMTIITMSQVANQLINTFLAAGVMTAVLYFSKSETATGRGFFIVTVIVSVVTCAMIWIAAIFCKEIQTPEEVKAAETKEKKPLMQSLQALFKNKQLLVTLLATLVGCMGNMCRGMLLSYYLIYCAGSYMLIAPVMAAQQIGQVIGNLPLPYLVNKFGKKRWYLISMALFAACAVVWFFLPMDSPAVVFIGLNGIIGFFMAATSCTYAFVCDCVEYGDLKYGVRDDGLAFSVMSFSVKLASAIMGSLGVILLSAVGYVANAEQTASALTGINVVVNIIPAALLLLGLVPFLLSYKLSNEKVERIAEELVKKRNGEAYEVIE